MRRATAIGATAAREGGASASASATAGTMIAAWATLATRARALGRGHATKTTKTTSTATRATATGTATARGGGKGRAKAKTGTGTARAAPTKAKTSRTKKPPIGKIRAVPHAEAKKFPLHESVLGDPRTYKATMGDAATAAKATARARASAPPPPTSGNRVMPHAKAATFPLHESVLAEAKSMATKGTVLREPLSKPAGAAATAPPAAANAAPTEESGSNRTALLAAAGAGIAAILAYSMSGVDEEDRPPPPRRTKPKAAAARKDVEVQIEIVKQPDAKELKKSKKVTTESKKDGKETSKDELSDAFSATADFLANVEVRNISYFCDAFSWGLILICRGFSVPRRTYQGPTLNASLARTHANRASSAAGVLRVVASPRLVPVSQPTSFTRTSREDLLVLTARLSLAGAARRTGSKGT